MRIWSLVAGSSITLLGLTQLLGQHTLNAYLGILAVVVFGAWLMSWWRTNWPIDWPVKRQTLLQASLVLITADGVILNCKLGRYEIAAILPVMMFGLYWIWSHVQQSTHWRELSEE